MGIKRLVAERIGGLLFRFLRAYETADFLREIAGGGVEIGVTGL